MFKMAAVYQEFPSESSLQELISSFPREWQGLFAALNVKESLAIHSGTKWLRDMRDSSSSLQKNVISPHWPDLVRSLCLLFPVVLNKHVVFQRKFACFTLKIQRNMLCFIVYHSDSIPVDDNEVFVSMLVKLPQMKQCWCAALVARLQTKIRNRETGNANLGKMDCSSSDLKKKRALMISAYCISESNKARLDNLCSRIKATSEPSSSLLNTQLEIMVNPDEGQIAAKGKELKIEHGKYNPVANMEVDNFIQSEVIEISDDSPEASESSLIRIPNIPDLSTHRTVDISVPVTSPTGGVSEVPSPPDVSTLQETKVCSPTASPTLSEIPNPPELDIQNMEIELSDDGIVNQYTHLKNHLRCSEDLDVELIQEFLNCFLENTLKDLVTICTFLEISSIPETSTIMLIKQFLLLEKDCSFQATVAFADHCIGVWLGSLQQAGSRNLLAAVTAFAQKHSKAFVDGVMVKQFNTATLLWPQSDLFVKVVKNFEKETLQYFIEKLVKSNERDSLSIWNEHMILVLSTVLERRLELDVSIFEQLVIWLQFQSLPLASSLKFAKLVLTLINKNGSLVKQRLTTFRKILEENNTFLKKPGLTALKKLED